jgi:hypothetical protein
MSASQFGNVARRREGLPDLTGFDLLLAFRGSIANDFAAICISLVDQLDCSWVRRVY